MCRFGLFRRPTFSSETVFTFPPNAYFRGSLLFLTYLEPTYPPRMMMQMKQGCSISAVFLGQFCLHDESLVAPCSSFQS